MRGDVDAELDVLTTAAGRGLLEEVAAVAAPGPADLARWRRAFAPGVVSAALRLADARRKGAAKFPRADQLWLEPVAVEQATAAAVARHKARRFAGAGVVVDLCSGLGGDALALAERGSRVLAVDRDHGMARRLHWNARVLGVSDRILAVLGRAESFPIPEGAAVHIDPDRRSRPGTRARRLADYAPGAGFLRPLIGSGLPGAIKLGPASDFDELGELDGVEAEVISLDGECKEATLWFGGFGSCRRRATCLPGGATWTDREGPEGARSPVGPIGPLLFEPDAALGRAGLLDGFAVAHGLRRLAPGIDWLTAQRAVDSPFLSAFLVEEVLPLDRKRLRRAVAGRGPLEIKTRGLGWRPEDLRRELRPDAGGRPATLLLHGGSPGAAIVARRIGAGGI